MKVLGIIPSRYSSTRLPGKPLQMIGEKSLVMRVYDQCKKVQVLDKVIVATDDDRIFNHVQENSGEAVMTAIHHQSGTERCHEAYENLGEKYDYIINIQGDEPFIAPEQINTLISAFTEGVQIATLIKHITGEEELTNPNIPKVAMGEDGHALYFSRSTIPYLRGQKESEWLQQHKFYKHIGIYGYRADILATIASLKPSKLEKAEQLEQLRWLSNGLRIKAVETDIETISVDTVEDLEKARRFAEGIK